MATTFAELRKTRFQTLSATSRGVCEYLEQLSQQTGTVIDGWTLDAFEGIDPSDRRAINRVFFARKDATPTLDPRDEERLAVAGEALEEVRVTRLNELRENKETYMRNARTSIASHKSHVSRAWNVQKEIFALEGRPASYVIDEVKKVIASGFWKFHGYEDNCLQLETAVEPVMTDINPAVNRNVRLNMGTYLGVLNVRQMSMHVERFKQNPVTDGGYFHPYVDSEGDICWGDSGGPASNLLAEGNISGIYELLANLLTTYGTGTPYVRLDDLARSRRLDADDEVEDEDTCDDCGNHEDECECYYCDVCERRTGTTRCRDHWCRICRDYQSDDEHGCCTTCNNTRHDCTCCRECGESDGNCDRCRECDRHEEHALSCSSHVAPTQEQSSIF